MDSGDVGICPHVTLEAKKPKNKIKSSKFEPHLSQCIQLKIYAVVMFQNVLNSAWCKYPVNTASDPNHQEFNKKRLKTACFLESSTAERRMKKQLPGFLKLLTFCRVRHKWLVVYTRMAESKTLCTEMDYSSFTGALLSTSTGNKITFVLHVRSVVFKVTSAHIYIKRNVDGFTKHSAQMISQIKSIFLIWSQVFVRKQVLNVLVKNVQVLIIKTPKKQTCWLAELANYYYIYNFIINLYCYYYYCYCYLLLQCWMFYDVIIKLTLYI